MDSVIAKLWYGDLSPIQSCMIDVEQEEDLIALMKKNKEVIWDSLEQMQKERFERFEECAMEYAQLTALHAFQSGFALAVKLMAESMM